MKSSPAPQGKSGPAPHRDLMGIPLCWIEVPGGTCLFGDVSRPRLVGDLLVALTPLTYGHVGRANDAVDPDLPITGIDHADASQMAELIGGRLPTSVEWEWLAAGAGEALIPMGRATVDAAVGSVARTGRDP